MLQQLNKCLTSTKMFTTFENYKLAEVVESQKIFEGYKLKQVV